MKRVLFFVLCLALTLPTYGSGVKTFATGECSVKECSNIGEREQIALERAKQAAIEKTIGIEHNTSTIYTHSSKSNGKKARKTKTEDAIKRVFLENSFGIVKILNKRVIETPRKTVVEIDAEVFKITEDPNISVDLCKNIYGNDECLKFIVTTYMPGFIYIFYVNNCNAETLFPHRYKERINYRLGKNACVGFTLKREGKYINPDCFGTLYFVYLKKAHEYKGIEVNEEKLIDWYCSVPQEDRYGIVIKHIQCVPGNPDNGPKYEGERITDISDLYYQINHK